MWARCFPTAHRELSKIALVLACATAITLVPSAVRAAPGDTADLSILSESTSSPGVKAGHEFTISLKAMNDGPDRATTVSVEVVLDPDVTLMGVDAQGGSWSTTGPRVHARLARRRWDLQGRGPRDPERGGVRGCDRLRRVRCPRSGLHEQRRDVHDAGAQLVPRRATSGAPRDRLGPGGPRWRGAICGLAGADRLYGRGGSDVLPGGSGNDLLVGGKGERRADGVLRP